ncbi:MAG: hypothetical protein ACYTG0_41990 [Planctomycetota bacterium]
MFGKKRRIEDAELLRRYREFGSRHRSANEEYWTGLLDLFSDEERDRLSVLYEEGIPKAICSRYNCSSEEAQIVVVRHFHSGFGP